MAFKSLIKSSFTFFFISIIFVYPITKIKAQSISALDSTIEVYGKEKTISSCGFKWKEAQKKYEAGLLQEVPPLLLPCLAAGFTKSEKIQAYRLLILTYIFLDEQDLSEKYMNELLVFEPDYLTDKELDPVEYRNLFEKFKVNPVFSYGFLLGGNLTSARLVNDFGVANMETSPSTYQAGYGFHVGLSSDFLLSKKLLFNSEIYFDINGFKNSDKVLPSSRTDVSESDIFIKLPLTIKYMIGKKKLKYFVRAGVGISYLLTSSATMVRVNTESNQNDFAGPSISMKSQRNALNSFAILGGGIHYKMGYGYLIIDARYNFGLSNLSKSSERYSNQNGISNSFLSQISPYGYVDNDFSLNNISLSAGYLFTIYKIKKVKTEVKLEQ
jgi:hypothetical protein